MTPITVSAITIYPVKSTAGISTDKAGVVPEGLSFDRRWAVADTDNQVITAREYPRLLAIHTVITGDTLRIMIPGFPDITVPLQPVHMNLIPVNIFGTVVHGNQLNETADAYVSAFLGIPCRLVFQDEGCERLMKPVYGGRITDTVSYADSAPIMLVSSHTLEELNGKLPEPVSMQRFRPNIVVTGCGPDEEDDWKMIQIGELIFDVNEKCKRCVMTTIDPATGERKKNQEPLRTLATYKPHIRGGVSFGVTLIPRSSGFISTGDPVTVLK